MHILKRKKSFFTGKGQTTSRIRAERQTDKTEHAHYWSDKNGRVAYIQGTCRFWNSSGKWALVYLVRLVSLRFFIFFWVC